MTALAAGVYPEQVGDSCGQFFSTALYAAKPELKPDARVLEIGCCEYNWLSLATTVWPDMTFTGIDWRRFKKAERATVIQGDVLTHPFEPASFDWIVSISALEHIGLGHYANDPKDADGDVKTLAKCWDWLAPGGWLYFDVPYNPAKYEVCGTSHRVYDDAAIRTRLHQGRGWRESWRGVVDKHQTRALVNRPGPLAGGESFYYIGFWWQKPGDVTHG